MAGERLAAAGLAAGSVRAFAGPRRLTLVVDGLPAAQPDRSEERKGPRVGRAGRGDRRLPALHRTDARAAGRTRRRLVRPDRDPRAADRGDHRRDGPGHRAPVPLAEVDEVGRRPGPLGEAAQAHPLRLRRRGRALQRRGGRKRGPERGPSLHGLEAALRGAKLRRLRAGAGGRFRRAGRSRAQGAHSRGRAQARRRPRSRAGRGRGLAGRSRGPRRMAGGADGRHGRELPRSAARGDPHLHAHAPALLRGAQPAGLGPRAPLHLDRQHRG